MKNVNNKIISLENELNNLKRISINSNFVESFEDACEILDVNDRTFVFVNPFTEKDILAYEKLKIIVKVLRDGWKPNWTDLTQMKYYPYFDMRPDVNMISVQCICHLTTSVICSKLCVDTPEKAEHLGTMFIELYKDLLTE